ncbi:DUF4231 domain-containing protein (plasmid) [Rhizobium ruizarguesonis]|nr:DUF4231 domain-containing protein [Rhizobium leguminosarum]MBY5883982.1 DUF4231 domain-containing protein [Rhizobium leguminosarum]TBD93124.1 DUF4231 domain-containing protein [Rhizobium ruizarguesonis]TBE62961.1 DUF4231 domain-containing protein [Rhizobium ruizarguesonis]TBE74387.1 DUF4231 domain-containing protein [Rhizobium ruizarguesonis]
MTPLEFVAQRQAVWSATAGALKAALDRIRWTTFTLSIIGALLATLAAQTTADVRWGFAMAGAAALATGTFLTSRMMGGAHTAEWVRARAASEALKREGYKFAARCAPYDNEATRQAQLNTESGKIEDSMEDLAGKEVQPKSAGTMPTADITAEAYIADRITLQCDHFFDPKAEGYRRLAERLGWMEFGLALTATLITAIVGATDKASLPLHFDFVALAAVFTTIGGTVTAHIEATRCNFLVTSYRATARRLRNELTAINHSFETPSAEWSAFVTRCETILADESGAWIAKWTK